ncbi:MAG: ribonuclease HI family protein [Candidatus Aenigmarchaeota archaeon]|nr:ribonuclease HI family protein [Candidatus Aenigmarchaeota archaeon]
MIEIFTDGSGKTGRYAYVVEQTGKVKIQKKVGITNNEAEYLAVIEALTDNKDKEIKIYSDSELIVNQLNKKYAIKEDRLRDLAQKVWELCEGRNITFRWIRREYNKAGKVLG